MIKGNEITKMSQYFQTTCLQEQAPPALVLKPDSLLASSHHKMKILCPWIDPHNLKKLNGEWWKEHRRVVTGNQELRCKIIYNHHDLVAFGHPGISRTAELVSRFYWWPNLAKDVQEYVKGCAKCQRHKINTQAQKVPLSPITPVHEALPFQTIALDLS
jgi:hypothetical protein